MSLGVDYIFSPHHRYTDEMLSETGPKAKSRVGWSYEITRQPDPSQEGRQSSSSERYAKRLGRSSPFSKSISCWRCRRDQQRREPCTDRQKTDDRALSVQSSIPRDLASEMLHNRRLQKRSFDFRRCTRSFSLFGPYDAHRYHFYQNRMLSWYADQLWNLRVLAHTLTTEG